MIIATHSGTFHADDVFSIATLLKLYPKATIMRTRDEEILKKADIRVDVGGKYCFNTNDFDHHQIGGAGCRENTIPYSGFGLIWKHFGTDYCKTFENIKSNPTLVRDIIDKRLVQAIDALDNGVTITESIYNISSPTVSHIISIFNPSWCETNETQEAFMNAVKIASLILEREIRSVDSVVRAEKIIKTSLRESKDGKIVILPHYVPWETAIMRHSATALYVIYEKDSQYYIRCVPYKLGSFEVRKNLPWEWSGLREKELTDVTNVEGSIFCHNGCWIAAANSLNGAIQLAEIASMS